MSEVEAQIIVQKGMTKAANDALIQSSLEKETELFQENQ
jgi:hypothetical protein